MSAIFQSAKCRGAEAAKKAGVSDTTFKEKEEEDSVYAKFFSMRPGEWCMFLYTKT